MEVRTTMPLLFPYMVALAALLAICLVYSVLRYTQLQAKFVVITQQLEQQKVEQQRALDAQRREMEVELKEQEIAFRKAVEEELREDRVEMNKAKQRLEQREDNLDKKKDEYERKEQSLNDREMHLDERETELDEQEEQRDEELQRIARLTRDEARDLLMRDIERDMAAEVAALMRRKRQQALDEAQHNASKIVVNAIQNCAVEQTTETTVSVVSLPSEEMKGRIIGREGRNIRAFEQATGIDLIVDDTPEAVVLSGFDPVRREVARIALERLVSDGRIHPARIEEMIEKAQSEIAQKIKDAGEKAAFEAGVSGLHPELLRLLGRLQYRTSFGQNVLKHSIEVSLLAGRMAGEVGARAEIARRAGILHDLGKAVDADQEGPHALLGAELALDRGEKPEVVHPIEAHHDDVEIQTVEAALVQAADAISASRPGARRETLEKYIKRLEALEEIARTFDGVERVYAIQAGREIRVTVKPDKIDDLAAYRLARGMAERIQAEVDYPGQIRVTIIRETRSVEYAK